MANEINIKSFSAADIERYHKGLLSAKERHALEKAALDDPFLADALEGYALPGVNPPADIAELKDRLASRVEKEKAIVMGSTRSSFPWLRAAAIVILIAGAGLLVYQFSFNNKKESPLSVTNNNKTEVKPQVPVDTNTSIQPGTTFTATEPATVTGKTDNGRTGYPRDTTPVGSALSKQSTLLGDSGYTESTVFNKVSTVKSNAPEIPRTTPARTDTGENFTLTDVSVNRGEVKDKVTDLKKENNTTPSAVFERDNTKLRNATANRKMADDQTFRSNIFRGRVTDADNNGLPFARVTNTEDNVGTYADARGYFNMLSPDTVLTVQVRSNGFTDNNIQLRNTVPNNQVIMKEDKSLNEVVIGKKPNAELRSGNPNIKLEEPVPVDGWENYDTYIANNLNVPEDYKVKPSNPAEVEISFEVDKNGEPINIRVEKSLCSKCDQEAIRLIKEGPKWKRKAKKGRTTVKVPFTGNY
jgi:hypothetical protein